MTTTETSTSLIEDFKWAMENALEANVVEILKAGEKDNYMYLRVDLMLPLSAAEMLAGMKYELTLARFEARLKTVAWAESPPILQEDEDFLMFGVSFEPSNKRFIIGYWKCEEDGTSDSRGDFFTGEFDEVETIGEVDDWWTELTSHGDDEDDEPIALTDFQFIEFLKDDDEPRKTDKANVQKIGNAVK